MFIVNKVAELEANGFKEYKSGYSKKLKNSNEFSFLDINFADLIVRKVKFVDTEFVSIYADKNDVKDLLEKEIVIERLEV